MKNLILLFGLAISLGIKAQIQQNINTPSGTVSNFINEIDSIRFNIDSEEMHVVFQGGVTESHLLEFIDNVTFDEAIPCNTTPHSCGAPSIHNPDLEYGSLSDQEGNVYKTIVIGSQEWMAENLNTSIYLNGEPIPNVTDSLMWPGLTSGAWCYYNNDSLNKCPYGKLYNWYSVVSTTNKICPLGWHVPMDADWNSLINYFDSNAIGGMAINSAGGKLKSSCIQYWLNPNQDANNESGFSGLPGGYRYTDGSFSSIGTYGNWWGSWGGGYYGTWSRSLNANDGSASRHGNGKQFGLSIRCVKD